MFFKRFIKENSDEKLVEKIKMDLISTLQRKNITVSKIHVDMKCGNVSLEVSLMDCYRY